MKKLSLALLLAICLLIPQNIQAASPISYANQINVAVLSSSSTTLKTEGAYQVLNNDTKSTTLIPSGTTLSIKKASNGINISFTGYNQTSQSGFHVQEITGVEQLTVFNSATTMHSGASTSYPVSHTFQAGSSAFYLDSFTNAAGENWYNVSVGSLKGWVPAKNVTLKKPSALSLATLSNGTKYRGSFQFKVSGSQVQVINYLDMENYLKGVVPSEMPASWHKEALKAQAIAARSFAANSMLLSNSAASQVYRGYSGEDSRTNAAIEETAGLLVKYNGKPIQTFFHSTSGGRTANVGDVWNSNQTNFPYLVSVDDPYETSPYSNWQETFTPAAILKSFGFTNTSATIYDITYKKSGANGEVTSVTVKTSAGDKTITGNESVIRKAFPLQSSSHYNQLYSNWFDIELVGGQMAFQVQTVSGTSNLSDVKGVKVQTASGQVILPDSKVSIQTANGIVTNEGTGVSSIVVKGKGWGHRIGMSQYGAKGLAEKGWKAEQIITHYFKGTTVSK